MYSCQKMYIFCPLALGKHRIDRAIVIGHFVIQSAHPVSDGRRPQQTSDLVQKRTVEFHGSDRDREVGVQRLEIAKPQAVSLYFLQFVSCISFLIHPSSLILHPFDIPLAGKDFNRLAGHVNVVVGFVPLEFQVSAGQMGNDISSGAAGQYSGDANGASPGAAGQGLAAASLPDAHPHFAGREDLDELGVRAIGKMRIDLDARADLQHPKVRRAP